MAGSRKSSSSAHDTSKGRHAHSALAAAEASAEKSDSGERQVVLRIPEDILNQVDKAVRKRAVRIPRHTWLLEAVVEKLGREVAQGGNGHGTK